MLFVQSSIQPNINSVKLFVLVWKIRKCMTSCNSKSLTRICTVRWWNYAMLESWHPWCFRYCREPNGSTFDALTSVYNNLDASLHPTFVASNYDANTLAFRVNTQRVRNVAVCVCECLGVFVIIVLACSAVATPWRNVYDVHLSLIQWPRFEDGVVLFCSELGWICGFNNNTVADALCVINVNYMLETILNRN